MQGCEGPRVLEQIHATTRGSGARPERRGRERVPSICNGFHAAPKVAMRRKIKYESYAEVCMQSPCHSTQHGSCSSWRQRAEASLTNSSASKE
eukprot:5660819-Amphidinium_carterae.1